MVGDRDKIAYIWPVSRDGVRQEPRRGHPVFVYDPRAPESRVYDGREGGKTANRLFCDAGTLLDFIKEMKKEGTPIRYERRPPG